MSGRPRRCHAAVIVCADRTYRPQRTEEVAMSTPDDTTKGVKTLGTRLMPDTHAQLSFIAQLRGGTITDEIQLAIASHIQAAKNDPELQARAVVAQADIEREAAARQKAIASLFDPTADASATTGPDRARATRRTPKGGDTTPEG